MPTPARRGGLPFLVRVGNLSAFLTLVALLGVGYQAAHKLDSLANQAALNCRSINGAIIVTLELSRADAVKHHNGAELDRTIARFADVEATC